MHYQEDYPCPEGTDNENVVVLPEHLFVNLIDMELQRRIANTEDMDYDVVEAIKGLLGEGPNEAKKDLEDCIRKKGFGSGETQVALGNFYSPKEYLALWAAQVSLGVSGCL